MNIPVWIRSEYVTYIGIALLSFVPSGHDIWRVAPPKMEGKPPGSLTFRNCIIACLLPSHNQFFITWSFLEPFDHPTDAPLYSKILKFKTYDNKSGTSTTNSHIRTQEIIEASCEYDGQPFLLLIQNPEGSNELLLIYDIGYPYVVGLKITYYGGSAGPRMVLYRRITTEWNTPQIINTTKAT